MNIAPVTPDSPRAANPTKENAKTIQRLEKQKESLKEQIKKVNENKELPKEEKKARVDGLQKKIQEIDKQIQEIQKQIPVRVPKEIKEADKDSPPPRFDQVAIGQERPASEPPGLYDFQRDADGNTKISFDRQEKTKEREEEERDKFGTPLYWGEEKA